MSNPKELMKSVSGMENISELPQAHTVVIDGTHVVLPYTVDTIIGTKNQTSSLDDDLREIDRHINGVISGDVLVGHAEKANRLTTSRKITLSGDVSGQTSFDGSKDVTLSVSVSDNSHGHTIANVKGLQEALNNKLGIDHNHKEWHTFKKVSIGNGGVEATTVEDTFNLIGGENISLNANSKEKTITINANMTDVEADVAKTLRGVKIQFDADRSQNETYIPVVSYSLPLEVGPNIDFHLSGSKKDFDARLMINPAGALNYTVDGRETYRIFHEGNDGHHSGLDADTLDGKHATSFSSSDHNHDDKYLSGVNGEMPTDLIMTNGKFIKGRKTDKSAHPLIGISGGNVLDLGATTLPMTIWSQGNPCVGVGNGRKAIYHEGNKPSWSRDITGIPSTFPPGAHRHPSSDISDATSNNTPNTIVKRDGAGNFSTNVLTSNNVTTSGITLSHSGMNRFVTEDQNNGWIAFHTGSSSIADALRLNKDGTAVFGSAVTIGGRATLEGGVDITHVLTSRGWANFMQGITVQGASEFKSDLTARGHLWADRISTNYMTTGNFSASKGMAVQGASEFNGDLTVKGHLWADRLSAPTLSATNLSAETLGVSKGITVQGASEFKSDLTVRGLLWTPRLSAEYITSNEVDMGNYLKLNKGADGTGFDNRNNANIDTWYGFSISNLCGGQRVQVGKPAFSVNARNGNVYAFGNIYADKIKRVYHEGNFHFSTSDSPRGGVDGDLWFTYEG